MVPQSMVHTVDGATVDGTHSRWFTVDGTQSMVPQSMVPRSMVYTVDGTQSMVPQSMVHTVNGSQSMVHS